MTWRRAPVGSRWVRDLYRRRRVADLIEILADARWHRVRAAAVALGRLHAETAVPALARCLRHEVGRVRLAAAAALGAIPRRQSAERLAEAVLEIPAAQGDDPARWDWATISACCRSLGGLRDAGVPVGSECTNWLLELNASWPGKKYGRPHEACLGYLHDPAALPALLAQLEQLRVGPWASKEGRMRNFELQRIAQTLAELGDPGAREPLASALNELPEENMRLSVAGALARLGDDRGKDHLVAVARAGGPYAGMALRALGETANPAWTDDLSPLMRSPKAASRTLAAIALARAGRRDLAEPALREFTQHPDRHSRDPNTAMIGIYIAAVRALGDPLEAEQPPTDEQRQGVLG